MQAVAASPDGTRLYIGGDFTSANGVNRYRLAAYNTATGALITTFAPVLNGGVRAIVATNTTVYVGGAFTTADGNARSKLAAFSATNGALLSWDPSANDGVTAMVMAPDQSKIIVGGVFTTLNGTNEYGMGAVDPTTGAILPWAANATVKDAGANAAIDTLTTDGTNIYGGGYVFGSGGNLEGVFAADPSTGAIKWIEDCHGDTYATYSDGNAMYEVGHPHYCDDVPNGFPQNNPWVLHRSQAFSTAVAGTLSHNTKVRTLTSAARRARTARLVPDADARHVHGPDAGGLDRHRQRTVRRRGRRVPDGQRRRPARSGALRGPGDRPEQDGSAGHRQQASCRRSRRITSGTARVAFQANWDQDDTALTYKVVRDSNTAHPVFTTTVNSTFFNRPMLGFTDTGLVVGQSYKYRLYVTDPLGNQVAGDTVTFTSDRQHGQPLRDRRSSTTRLTRTGDWARHPEQRPTTGPATPMAPSAPAQPVAQLERSSVTATPRRRSTARQRAIVSHPYSQIAPNSFSIEGWFKTTGTSGGRILGFGDTQAGTSGVEDRTVYINRNGQLSFGVISGSTVTGTKTTITSPVPSTTASGTTSSPASEAAA